MFQTYFMHVKHLIASFQLENPLKTNANSLELLNLPDLAPIIHTEGYIISGISATISICQTRNFEMIGKLYLSGQTREEETITAHQSLYLLDPTTEKWSLLLLSTNSMSFLKLAYAKNIPHSKFPLASAVQQFCEHAQQYKDL